MLIGLAPGAGAKDLSSLLQDISARVYKSPVGQGQGFFEVEVPSGTERNAILRAYDHPCVSYAQLSWNESIPTGVERIQQPPPPGS